MSGLSRLFWAGAGAALRALAGLPLGCGELLLRAAEACEARARPERERLRDRRVAETFDFSFSQIAEADRLGQGFGYTATVGRHADGRIAEVFLDAHKLASQLTDDARDAALVLSLALQHGMPLTVLARSVSRFDDGRPCTLVGRLADLLIAQEAKPAPSPSQPSEL